MRLTGAQCRAARAWCRWTQEELAKRAGVGVSTVRSLEDESHAPIQSTGAAIRRALEDGGGADVLLATDGKAAPTKEGGRGNTAQVKRSRRSGRGTPRETGDGGKRGK